MQALMQSQITHAITHASFYSLAASGAQKHFHMKSLQRRWNPFVRSKIQKNVGDQLSKLAGNEREVTLLTTRELSSKRLLYDIQ